MNGSVANGQCDHGHKEQNITISYSNNRTYVSVMSITLTFKKDNNSDSMYQMTSFLLKATINKVNLNGWFF